MKHVHIMKYEDDDIYGQHEMARCIKATDAYLALNDMQEAFRQELKYNDHEEPVEEALERMRDKLIEILEMRCIDLENELD